MQDIKQRTAALHQVLESCSLAALLMSPGLSMQRYVQILIAWGGAWRVLEAIASLSRDRAALQDLAPVARAHLADLDLGRLGTGHAIDARQQRAMCKKVPLFELDSAGELLGLYYVLRGSALGAQMIARHLQDSLGIDAEGGASFFALAEEYERPWDDWARRAEPLLAPDEVREAAVRGAVKAYSFLLDWFERSNETLAPLPATGGAANSTVRPCQP